MVENLVSVIVPVYNVEKYVAKCLDSLISQTYDNIQIIIVNDGSSDRSLDIVERYKNIDSRVKVYNKKNGGLSDARNTGIKYAEGEFICFVDSDDWVSSDYVETLISMFEEKVDITCGGFVYYYNSRKIVCMEHMKNKVLSNKEATKALCNGKWMTNHVWNKMYRRKLFSEIQFEVGKHFEDIYIMHQLFARANKVACTDKIIYYYSMRDDSIIHQNSAQNEMDIFIGYYKRFLFLKDAKLQSEVLKYCAWACYKIIYLADVKSIDKRDLEVATDFWKTQNKIKRLGIKYYFMYKFPGLYRKFITKKIC